MTGTIYTKKHEEIISIIFGQADGTNQLIKELKEDNTHKEQIIDIALREIRILSYNSYNMVKYAREKDLITYDESIHIYEFSDKQIRSIYNELQKL